MTTTTYRAKKPKRPKRKRQKYTHDYYMQLAAGYERKRLKKLSELETSAEIALAIERKAIRMGYCV